LVDEQRYIKYTTAEEDLLVFSKTSGRLYGFDQHGASLFAFLEEDTASKEELLQHIGNDENIKSVINTISDLLNGQEAPEEETIDPFDVIYPPKLHYTHYKNPFYYQLDTFIFVIDTDNKFIIEKILPALSHLERDAAKPEEISVNINLEKEKEKWYIHFNGEKVYRGLEFDEILPRLMDNIRIAYYHSTDYLVSLHAGALYFKNTPLILPAVSGSGKSTLSTYLMEQDFDFLTDEVAVIDKKGYMRPIPMAITLKEGSWKALEEHGISLSNLSIHRRFDGQNIRFLSPKNIATENLDVAGAYLIFPRYEAGETTQIKKISTLETLSHITASGYEVMDSFDKTTIAQWIKIVEGFKKFTLIYSDMEDARQEIEKLMAQ